MKKQNKKVVGLVSGAIVGGLLIGVGGAGVLMPQPEPKIIEKPVIVNQTKVVEKEVPVNQTVEKIVEVDNGNLDIVCKWMEDKEMVEDVKTCVAEVKAEDEALSIAIDYIEKEFADYLDDEGLVQDEEDIKLIRVYDNLEDVEVVKSDFEDNEYKFEIDIKLDDYVANDKKKFRFTVEVNEQDPKILDAEEI